MEERLYFPEWNETSRDEKSIVIIEGLSEYNL